MLKKNQTISKATINTHTKELQNLLGDIKKELTSLQKSKTSLLANITKLEKQMQSE